MEPSSTQTPDATEPNGRTRVAVWSPFSPLVRALRALIERSRDLVVVELKDHQPLPQAARTTDADVFIADVDAAAGGAGRLVADTHRSNPRGRILALSAHADRRLADGVLAAGAAGYLLKDRAFEELADAVRAVARGERYVSRLGENAPRNRRELGSCEAPNQVRPDSSAAASEA
jgi:DNA-binding NarL/FixJ family response regulator